MNLKKEIDDAVIKLNPQNDHEEKLARNGVILGFAIGILWQAESSAGVEGRIEEKSLAEFWKEVSEIGI